MTVSTRQPDAGFTLIETLVALAVLAVGSMALLAGVERHAANTRGLEDRTVALWVAENALAATTLGLELDATWTRALDVDWRVRQDAVQLRDTAQSAVTVRVADAAVGPDAVLVTLTGYVPVQDGAR